jgi:hypothetical protein
MITKITEQELASLKNTSSMEEWNDLCDEIKKVRGGVYPSDWWAVVMTGGVAAAARKNWTCICGEEH